MPGSNVKTYTQEELEQQRTLREQYRKNLFQVNGHQVENLDDLEAYLDSLDQRERESYYEDYKKGGAPISELVEDTQGLSRVYTKVFRQLIRNKDDLKELQRKFNGASVIDKNEGKVRIDKKAIYNKFFSGKDIINYIKDKAKQRNVPEEKINALIASAVKEEVNINKANLEDEKTLAQKNSEILAQGGTSGKRKSRFIKEIYANKPKVIDIYAREDKVVEIEQKEQEAINNINEEIFDDKGFDDTRTTIESHLNALDSIKDNYKTTYQKNELSYKNEIYGIANLYHKAYAQHQTRSFFNKLFHPFKNSAENRLINNLKTRLTNLNVSNQDINKLQRGEFDHEGWKGMSTTKFEPQYQQLQSDLKTSIDNQVKQILDEKRESKEKVIGRTNVVIRKEGHERVIYRREKDPRKNNLDTIKEDEIEQIVDNDPTIDDIKENNFIEDLEKDVSLDDINIENNSFDKNEIGIKDLNEDKELNM